MSERIVVKPLGPHEWAVDVTEGTTTTHHRVRVPEELLADLGVAGADEETAVAQSFHFLLDKEPATSIHEEFALDLIAEYFPDYPDELRTRLAG